MFFLVKIFNLNNFYLLEIIGTIISIYSIYLSHRVNIKTYPLSIISTIIYIYISYKINIYANMIINICYLIMNLYGWYIWKYNTNYYNNIKITYSDKIDYIKSLIFTIILEIIIYSIYYINGKFLDKKIYLDIVTSFLFFIAMYHMIIKKLETWIFWTMGNFISIILYLYHGMTITSIQYIIYTLLSIKGYFLWRKKIYSSY